MHIHTFPASISEDLVRKRNVLCAKRKTNLILSSKTTQQIEICLDEFIQMYVKQQNEKRWFWSAPKPVLSFDFSSQTIIVSGP